jgi:hypothetical protein
MGSSELTGSPVQRFYAIEKFSVLGSQFSEKTNAIGFPLRTGN